MIILNTSELKKYYGEGEAIVKALDGVDFTVNKGEFVAIVGSSGSGKSTLLHMLGGLDIPTFGSVKIDEQELEKMTENELTIFRRRKIGFIFQNYNLLPLLTVYENIILPIQLDNRKIDKEYIEKLIESLGLLAKRDCMPNCLSGGQQQRVAIARALATKPAIVLADEPTGNLDSKTSKEVLELLKVTSQRYEQTIVMITHDGDIAKMASRIIRIEDGKMTGKELA